MSWPQAAKLHFVVNMAALTHPSLLPAGSLPEDSAGVHYRRASALWLALELIDPVPEAAALESLATWAEALTPTVVLRPDEGLLLEIKGSLKYFAGLEAIRQQLTDELERRGCTYRLATAPTPLAASWLVRCCSADVTEESHLAGAIGRLPLAATGWPESVLGMLSEMGLRSIADCLRLPRAGFARRMGRDRLDELDRALGKKPDFCTPYRAPNALSRVTEFAFETSDQAIFTEALCGMAESLERELRQRQAQVAEIALAFRHLRCEATLTRIRFVDPVHERNRILQPLLARIECIEFAEPVLALALTTSILLPLRIDLPELLPALPDDPPRETGGGGPASALVECLRGRFGERRVYGINAVAEHRPERAWSPSWLPRIDLSASSAILESACPAHGRPLWLLPEPRRSQLALSALEGHAGPERIESGWWDGQDVRRDYHVAIGPGGEKLWLYRDCLSNQWYLHGIFG